MFNESALLKLQECKPQSYLIMCRFLILAAWLVVVAAIDDDWLINEPNTPWPELQLLNDEVGMGMIVDEELRHVSGASDGELPDALEHFFWNQGGGIVIEMGSLDGGAENSVSKGFEKLGWKRILLEANPIHREALKKQDLAFSVNAAICDGSAVHFVAVTGGRNMTSGIVEFMEPKFVKEYHRVIYKLGSASGKFDPSSINWQSTYLKDLHITPVQCITLDTVLKRAGVSHVNFMVLDVEGAELAVLKSLDLDAVRIDVMAIERNNGKLLRDFFNRDARMSELYEFVAERGRNYWLMRKDYTPSRRPGVSKDCFRGSVKSRVLGSKWQLCKGSLVLPSAKKLTSSHI